MPVYVNQVMLENFANCAIGVTDKTHQVIALTCARIKQSQILPLVDILVERAYVKSAQEQNMRELIKAVLATLLVRLVSAWPVRVDRCRYYFGC